MTMYRKGLPGHLISRNYFFSEDEGKTGEDPMSNYVKDTTFQPSDLFWEVLFPFPILLVIDASILPLPRFLTSNWTWSPHFSGKVENKWIHIYVHWYSITFHSPERPLLGEIVRSKQSTSNYSWCSLFGLFKWGYRFFSLHHELIGNFMRP